MASRSQRRMAMKYAHITAIVVGVFIALVGLYFITVIRGDTDRKNAECTEKTAGTVTEVVASGSQYVCAIDYVAEDVDCTTTVMSKNDLGVGSSVDVYYEPLTVKHIYIDGITPTGAKDVRTGLIMLLVGAVFIAYGVITKKMKAAS